MSLITSHTNLKRPPSLRSTRSEIQDQGHPHRPKAYTDKKPRVPSYVVVDTVILVRPEKNQEVHRTRLRSLPSVSGASTNARIQGLVGHTTPVTVTVTVMLGDPGFVACHHNGHRRYDPTVGIGVCVSRVRIDENYRRRGVVVCLIPFLGEEGNTRVRVSGTMITPVSVVSVGVWPSGDRTDRVGCYRRRCRRRRHHIPSSLPQDKT